MNMVVPRYIYVLVNYMTVYQSAHVPGMVQYQYHTSGNMFDIMWQMSIGSGCNAPNVQTVII